MSDSRPLIAITMGDAAGVGPEIIVKALSTQEIFDCCRPLVIGDARIIRKALRSFGVQAQLNLIEDPANGLHKLGTLDVFDLHNLDPETVAPGQVQEHCGRASVEYVQKAVELALSNKIQAIVTAPISKEAINKAGYDFAGHTELLAHLTNSKDYAMLLVAKNLRVIHVTTHTSLAEACHLVRRDRVERAIRLAFRAAQSLGIPDPKIGVAALNPHSGEGGLFGREEIEEITPAIESARRGGISVEGPIPSDTVFYRAAVRGEFDLVVAMYHDQGHIPVKLIGFESGVNVTVGLPIVRTSVDHGTAYRRAWRGTASPQSMIEAVKLAATMTKK